MFFFSISLNLYIYIVLIKSIFLSHCNIYDLPNDHDHIYLIYLFIFFFFKQKKKRFTILLQFHAFEQSQHDGIFCCLFVMHATDNLLTKKKNINTYIYLLMNET